MYRQPDWRYPYKAYNVYKNIFLSLLTIRKSITYSKENTFSQL